MSISSEAKKEVERLLLAGEKLNAVSYLQEKFGISPMDAGILVDAVESEMRAQLDSPPSANPDIAPRTSPLPPELYERVVALIRENRKIEAIKEVKAALSLPLREAMVLVEDVHRETDPGYKSYKPGCGCAGGLMSLAIGISATFALFLLASAAYLYGDQQAHISSSTAVEGTVTGFEYSEEMSAPVISYEFNGRPYTHHSKFFSNPPAYSQDQKVTLYVNNDDPSDLLIDSYAARWLGITLLGGFGLVALAVMVALILSRRKLNQTLKTS